MADKKEESPEEGELLFCGTLAWDNVGRKPADTACLPSPARLKPLVGVSIRYIATGCVSAHCIALDSDGRCFTWGRNEKGQLGSGDLLTRSAPTLVTALSKHHIVKAGAGRNHTVVITRDGTSLAFGHNKHGQLGSGHTKAEIERLPVKCLVPEPFFTYCGAEFTVWLSSSPGASILSAGLPQYGQLGHGTDNEYNAKEGSVRLAYEAQPRPRAIAALAGKTIVKVACGSNHTVAVDSEGFVYTWGFGGHGRLGHKEQKDEWVPRLVETFQKGLVLPPSAVVGAGSAFSACTSAGGQLYMWGRVKSTGDNWMYPKPVFDISGWNIRSIDCGNTSTMVSAEDSCISWGLATTGELGYGASGPKSSAQPKKVDALEGMHVIRVACGIGHSLMIVDRSKRADVLEKLDIYECPKEVPGEGGDTQSEEKKTPNKPGRKRKGAEVESPEKKMQKEKTVSEKEKTKKTKRTTKANGRKPPAEELSDTEDDVESDVQSDSSEEEATGRRPGRGRGRARGKGANSPFKSTLARGRKKEDSADISDGETETMAKETLAASKGRGRGRGRGCGRGKVST